MANELPQYQSQEQIRPAPIANASEPFNRLSSLLDTYSTKRMAERQQIVNMQAAEQGEAAGYNLNYQPATGGSQADMYYNKAARQANRLAVGADISANISRIKSGIINSPTFNPQTASQEFAHAVQGYSDGLLSNIPKSNQTYAQNILKYHAAEADNQIASHVAGATKASLFVDGYQINEQFLTGAKDAAFKGDEKGAAVMFGQLRQNVELGVQSGIYSPGYAARLLQDGHKELIFNTYLGQAQRAIDDGKIDDFYKSFKKHDFTKDGLNETEWKSLNARVFGLVQTARRGEEMNGKSLELGIADNVARASQGKELDPSVEQQIALYPEKKKQYDAAIDSAKLTYSATQGLHDTPIEQRPDIMANFVPDPKKEGYAKQLVAYNQIQKISAQQIALMETDPVAYTQQSPLYNAIFSRFQQTKDFNAYNKDILAYQSSVGVQPEKQRVMSNAQAAGLVSKIKSSDYDTGLNQLKQLQASYGKYMPIAMKSLTAQGLPKTYNMLLGMQDIPKSAPAVPDAVQAFSLAEGKVPGGKGNELETLFKNSGKDAQTLSSSVQKNIQGWLDNTNAYSAMSGESQAEYIAGVTNLAKFYASKGDNEKDAAKKAYDALIGNKYSAIEGTYRVPQGISPDVVRFTLNEKDKELSSFNFQELRTANPYLSKQYLDERNFKDAIIKGHWVSMPDDSGWARVDVNGMPVKDKQGNLFKVTNQDLFSPPIQQKIEQQGTSEIAQKYGFEGLK